MELNDLLNEKEWRACKGPENATNEQLVDAFVYFCSNYWFIKHPEKGRIKFEMREAQIETVAAWLDNRYSIVLKARQIGFSTLCAAYVFWVTYFWKDRFVIMLSRTEREAMKLLAKSKYGFKFLPKWMILRGPSIIDNNQLKMSFSNESAVESLPSGNDPARGESVFLVVIDEMAFLPNSDEAWASIEPIADVGGRVICLSTANGEGNIFHELWVGSQTGSNQFKGIFFPWSASDRDDNWYQAKKRQLPDWQLAQEYPSDPDEAFIRSGRPVFDLDALRSMEIEEPKRGYLHVYSAKNFEFRIDGGELAVWEMPELGGIYCIGADVAEGLGYGDYSTAHVINGYTQQVVAHWHGHIDPDIFGEEILANLGWWYSGALIGVESNNHGLTTLKALQRSGYKNIYRQRRLAQRAPVPTEVMGWRTTGSSKPLAIDELNANIRDHALDLRCEYTIGEMRTFVRQANGKTHGSPHDDRVMSLAIANQMLKYIWLPEYQSTKIIPKGSLLWWEEKINHNHEPKFTLGSFGVRNRT